VRRQDSRLCLVQASANLTMPSVMTAVAERGIRPKPTRSFSCATRLRSGCEVVARDDVNQLTGPTSSTPSARAARRAPAPLLLVDHGRHVIDRVAHVGPPRRIRPGVSGTSYTVSRTLPTPLEVRTPSACEQGGEVFGGGTVGFRAAVGVDLRRRKG